MSHYDLKQYTTLLENHFLEGKTHSQKDFDDMDI